MRSMKPSVGREALEALASNKPNLRKGPQTRFRSIAAKASAIWSLAFVFWKVC